VSETDGRAFIRSAPLSIWNDPFPPVQIPTSRKKREKAARLARTGETSKATSAPPDAVSSDTQPPSSASDPTPSAPVPSTTAPVEPERQEVAHFVMNLPDSALTFLDAYRGAYNALASAAKADGYDPKTAKMPMVHVHCFTREMERPGAEKDICQVSSRRPLPCHLEIWLRADLSESFRVSQVPARHICSRAKCPLCPLRRAQ
jgi:tRNA (guanine37-N1)-methyltransferase